MGELEYDRKSGRRMKREGEKGELAEGRERKKRGCMQLQCHAVTTASRIVPWAGGGRRVEDLDAVKIK